MAAKKTTANEVSVTEVKTDLETMEIEFDTQAAIAKKHIAFDTPVELDSEKYDKAYDIEPKELPPLVDPKNAYEIVSPFAQLGKDGGLRKRAGWHQTWKRDDEFRQAIDNGYRQIRRSKLGSAQAAGFETGGVIVKQEGNGTAIIAMEIPVEYYERHILAESSRSHMLYNDPDVVMKKFADGTGRDLSSKKEQVHLSVDYEAQRESLKR